MSTQEPYNHSNNSDALLPGNGAISYISGITRGSIGAEKSTTKKSAAKKRITENDITSYAGSELTTSKLNHNDTLPLDSDFNEPVSEKTLSQKPLSQKPLSQKPLSQKPLSQKQLSQKQLSQETFSYKTISKSSNISVANVREELMLLITELEELIEYNE